jgi:hypothetical protein
MDHSTVKCGYCRGETLSPCTCGSGLVVVNQTKIDVANLEHGKLLFVDFTVTVANQKERISKLEELVRELVKFSGHDPACAEMGLRPARSACTCGIRKLYERIDELME